MRIGGKRIWSVLALLLLLISGIVAYQVGLRLWARHHYHAAQQALEHRHFDQASVHLDKCLSVWSSDPTIWLLAARTARRRGDFTVANGHLQACERNNAPPSSVDLERKLLALQGGDLSEADLLLSFCTANPDDVDTPLILEALLVGTIKALEPTFSGGTNSTFERDAARPHFSRALQAAKLWLRLRPGQADQIQGLVWRSLIHAWLNDLPARVADLRKALQLDPDHFEARLQLALAVSQEAPAEAASHLQILRERDPNNKKVRFPLATARRLLGQLEESRKILDEMLADDPDAIHVLVERARLALDMQQPEQAERWLRHALLLAPDALEANLVFSSCLKLLGNPEEAKQYHEKFLKLEAARNQRKSQSD